MAKIKEFNNLTPVGVFRDYRTLSKAYIQKSVICSDVVEEIMGYSPKNLTIKLYDRNPKRKHTLKVRIDSKRSERFAYLDETGPAFKQLRKHLLKNDVTWITMIDEDKK